MSLHRTALAVVAGALAFSLAPAAAQAGPPPKQPKPPTSCKKQPKQKKCQPAVTQGRMTGHGHQFNVTANGVFYDKVQWEFRNSVCAQDRFPDLKVEFGKSRFILTAYNAPGLICEVTVPGGEGKPRAGFDTIRATGTGTLNGVPGATISFRFTDAGEPGRADTAEFTIMAPNGTIAYTGGALDGGNHQAHRK